MSDNSASLRRHAIRCAETRLDATPELLQRVLAIINDDDLQVRQQIAYSLGECADPQAAAGLADLVVRHRADQYLMAAVLSSVHASNWESILAAALNISSEGQPTHGLR